MPEIPEVPEVPEKWVRLSTAAKQTGLSVRILRFWITESRLPAIKPNGYNYMVRVSDVLKAIDEVKVEPPQ